jgi:hypothetical protein
VVTKLKAWETWLIECNAYNDKAPKALTTSLYGKAFSRGWDDAIKEAIDIARDHPDLVQALKEKL